MIHVVLIKLCVNIVVDLVICCVRMICQVLLRKRIADVIGMAVLVRFQCRTFFSFADRLKILLVIVIKRKSAHVT